MKLGSTTLLYKCAAGVRLPEIGPCPECGATSGEPCYKKSRQDAELLASLQTENEKLRSTIVDLVDRANAIDLWHQNWNLPFADDDEWLGDQKLWRESHVNAIAAVNIHKQTGGE
jgi:hypothetical protein